MVVGVLIFSLDLKYFKVFIIKKSIQKLKEFKISFNYITHKHPLRPIQKYTY